MLFRSELIASQWDTWCYFHAGTYYLYYLITESSPGEGFGVATSEDGVHWKDHGWAITASEKMVHFLGTGSVWPDPRQEGRFFCNYSEHRIDESGKRRQCILFAWSDDLIHWNKLTDDTIFWIDERYYERYGRWDCIFAIPRREGGYWGTWTATPSGRSDLNGGIGLGFSEDGVTWYALPRPHVEPDADESGAMVTIDSRLHAMFGVFGGENAGMNAYTAEDLEGPFRLAKKNALLLRARHTYFSRYFDSPDGLLINHHAMNGETTEAGRPVTYLAPFKRFTLDSEGTQRWMWWPGNEKLKDRGLQLQEDGNFQAGIVLEGTIDFSHLKDASMFLTIDDKSYAIRVSSEGRAEFLLHDASNDWVSLQTADRNLPPGSASEFRLVAKRGMSELYINDHFIESCILGGASAQSIQCSSLDAEDGGQIKDLKLWQTDIEHSPAGDVQKAAPEE